MFIFIIIVDFNLFQFGLVSYSLASHCENVAGKAGAVYEMLQKMK